MSFLPPRLFPRFTLFPYTTLFRSIVKCFAGCDPRDILAELRRRGLIEGRDRKSTRLNSSHTVISYAVFCLKKKLTYITTHYSRTKIYEEVWTKPVTTVSKRYGISD